MINRILNYSEKFFQTEIRYIIKGGFWLLTNKIVMSITSFALVIAFGNLVSKNSYGTYQYVLSIAGILAVTTLPGMTTALTQATARGKEGVIPKILFTRISWGILGAIGSLLISGYYFYQNDTVLALCFLIVALSIPFVDSFSFAQSVFFGRKEFKKYSIYVLILQIIQTISTIGLLFITQNIILIIAFYFFATLLIRLIFIIILYTLYPPNKEYDNSYLSYGKHLSLMSVLGTMATQADKIILWHFLGPVSLAIYSIAFAPISQIQTWFKSLETLAFSKFSSTDKNIIKKTLPRKLWYLRILIIPVIISYVILAPTLYKLFLPQYIESVIYSQVLALVLIFLPQKLIGSTLTAHSQKKALYIINTINPVFKISLLVIMVPFLGVWGVIISVIAPYLLNSILLNYFFKKI